MNCAHRKITVDVFGILSEAWVIPTHYCDGGPIGARSVHKRVREEAHKRGARIDAVESIFVNGDWEVRAHCTGALRPHED